MNSGRKILVIDLLDQNKNGPDERPKFWSVIMRKLILTATIGMLLFGIMDSKAHAVDNDALLKSLQYLNTKWVDEPIAHERQREIQQKPLGLTPTQQANPWLEQLKQQRESGKCMVVSGQIWCQN